MPSIVGYASNLNATSTATSFTLPSPASEPNDLFLAIIGVDTGSGVWSSPGWTLLSARTNTSQLVVMYKISSGSTEADDFTFTTTVAETFHGRVISIREVNTVTPFGSTALFKMDSQAAVAKYQFSSISTTTNSSLIIYACSSSVAGIPSIIEGPVTLLCGEDGSAESTGVGWSFKSDSGSTPTNVTCSNIAAGTGIKMVLQVRPPASGATRVPAFCTQDNSIYVDPINGVTAYNGNAALAATMDTNFATTISGVTLADGGVAAIADSGINPYHSAGRVTSISASKNWGGVALNLAVGNNIDTTGKNVLVHTGPSTPGQIQRLGPIAAQKGIIFGMQSTAENWKVWHVHGAGTPFGYQRDVPLVVNSSNTTGLLHTTGTFNPAATDIFGFAVAGGGVSTTVWDFYSLWVLDSTTICGGSLTTPVDIPGIVRAAADGHERKSLVQQGAAQAIIYQPIILGSGGTEPIYLDLDATAIEFPRQYSVANSQVNYCSVDGVAGITYWAGPTDTIKHRNSVISSPSPYHWGFHSGSSVSATYDFSGLQIIGAKPINTKSGITISSTIFNGCGTFNLSGMTLTNCTFASSIDTVALRVGTDGAFSGVTGCIFQDNIRAIEFISGGTYTMDGCVFENNTVDIWNSSSGAVIINATNGADPITTLNTGGGSITINNTKTLTITGLQADSEVRVYDLIGNELAGVEDSTDTFIYNYNYTGDTLTNIVIHHLDYQYILLEEITLSADGVSIPVQQQTDRNYLNPT